MKERPIPFSGPLVGAILDGRKTETRRPVRRIKDTDGSLEPSMVIDWAGWPCSGDERRAHPQRKCSAPTEGLHHVHYANGFNWENLRCPYGAPGDRLWVRETWKPDTSDDTGYGVCGIRYRADDAFVPTENSQEAADRWFELRRPEEQYPECRLPVWRPSIHMPRWATRILLEVLEVRVERVQEITEEGAQAEGFDPVPAHGRWVTRPRDEGGHWSSRPAFAEAWDSIYAGRKDKPGLAWEDNPWVWVVKFRRIEP